MSSFNYPLLIVIAPLAAGLMIGLGGRSIGPKIARAGVAAALIAFILALGALYQVTAFGALTFDLSPSADGIFQYRFYIDRLSAVMLVHIAAVSLLIHLFSVRYMQQERGYARFHSLLAFTTFVLFGMVSSANLLMLLAFWQLLSWFLPLLSYNYEHLPTVRGAFRIFILQRAGDMAFLAGIVAAYSSFGTLDFQELFARAGETRALISIWPSAGFEVRASTLLTLLIFIGAMSKSAQFPLHMWLPDSLYAPTPVSALLHAGIINAGGFLLARLAPLYGSSPSTLHLVFAVGILTALLGSSMMLVQSDIKKTLGYSTIGQMGFMIMECGLGAFGLAIFHLIAHGLFKATSFLNCGYVIHAARQEPRLPPQRERVDVAEFSILTWLTGFLATLVLPLIILLAAHGILDIPLRSSQGAVIFLFFGWATSAQAILTLYRLRAVASWKVAASMLLVLFSVVLTYLLAAESFTHFLFPRPGEAAYYFQAGALPLGIFDLLVAGFALAIILGWILIYAKSHGTAVPAPQWLNDLQVRVYLLLLNRLYLDALSFRLGRLFAGAIAAIDNGKFFPHVAAWLAVVAAAVVAGPPQLAAQVLFFFIIAFLLPLFPLHGLYIAALTRLAPRQAALLGALLPSAGLYFLVRLGPQIPSDLLRAAGVLALFGALYGSLKALAQISVPRLLAYAGVTFYSAFWWRLAAGQTVAGNRLVVYLAAIALLTAALLLTWDCIRARCGNLALDRVHGLARPMPRLATVAALLAMAALGLPPFGLFAGQVAILLQPAGITWGLTVVLFTWFLASWYLFRMMQQLFVGPYRSGFRPEDLGRSELAMFALLVLMLAGLGAAPWLTWNQGEAYRIALEVLWRK
ncbi:MAG TPA: proton-conducting transporter membrane subunit [Methylomirabilota bacterium]|nr:proton-conducting transporter membrane subunit [Methylomirabilota bacterium]